MWPRNLRTCLLAAKDLLMLTSLTCVFLNYHLNICFLAGRICGVVRVGHKWGQETAWGNVKLQNCRRWRLLTSGSEIFSTSGIKDGNNVISRNSVSGCQALEVPLQDPENQTKMKNLFICSWIGFQVLKTCSGSDVPGARLDPFCCGSQWRTCFVSV